MNRPLPAAPAMVIPRPSIAVPVVVEVDVDDVAPALSPDEQTDGFHFPPELMVKPTVLPGHTRPSEPSIALASALTLDFAGPAAGSEAGSQGDSWFGPAINRVPASEAPTMPLGETAREDILPLRIPEVRPGLGQRLAPVALATMAVSLGVWTMVQLLA